MEQMKGGADEGWECTTGGGRRAFVIQVIQVSGITLLGFQVVRFVGFQVFRFSGFSANNVTCQRERSATLNVKH